MNPSRDARTIKVHTSWRFVVLGFLMILTAACGSTAPEGPSSTGMEGIGQTVPVDGGGSYTDIIPQELKGMLEEKDFFFVNVHIPYEGEIPGTDAFIPFDKTSDRLDDYSQDKGAKIVVYCRSGSMSAIAAKELVQHGYTNVYNLDGGFRAWSAAGFEFIVTE